MRAAVVVFTRDLRVHDNPGLAEAVATAEAVVPLFVLDDGILRSAYNRPNRAHLLAACLRDLDAELRGRGAGLVVRRGDWVAEVVKVAAAVDAAAVHLARDVTGYSAARAARLAAALPCPLTLHDGAVTAVPPGGARHPDGGSAPFGVFTPYHRAWERELDRRPVVAAPRRLALPPGLDPTGAPAPHDICPGEPSPELEVGGERQARERLARWLRGGIGDYEAGNADMAVDGTSRLSGWLHFGALSAYEVVHRADRDDPGARAYVRQLAWRDYHAQSLAARPESTREDHRPRGDRWRDDPAAFDAWRAGRTGYPLVDAGMRQLARQGWMHNRARLVTGSFLTKTLYLDWRLGAQHFVDLLVDGDVANNTMNWQWIAGTGTDTRPGRVLNPVLQGDRYDPRGDYVRRWVPELADVAGPAVHRPWELPEPPPGYPAPIVDLAEGRERFAAARAAARRATGGAADRSTGAARR